MEPSSLAITAGAWAWDTYGKSLTDKTTGSVKERLTRFGWSRAAEAYRAKIKKPYGTMQIMGMAEPVPLDDIFTEGGGGVCQASCARAQTGCTRVEVRREGVQVACAGARKACKDVQTTRTSVQTTRTSAQVTCTSAQVVCTRV